MNKRLLALLCIAASLVGGLVWLWLVTDDVGSAEEDRSAVADGDLPVLSGRVIDASGRSVPGANVFAGGAHMRADDDGRFAFYNLPPHLTPVDATADGHHRAGVGSLGRPSIDLTGGARVDDLFLVLPRAASLSGRVVAGGRPVQGAEISLSYQFAEGLDGDRLKPHTISEMAITGSDGSFVLPSIAPGRFQIFVDTEEYGFAESDEIYMRQGQSLQELTIDVAPTGGLHGTIYDDDGFPVAATVTLEPDDPELIAQTTNSNDDGHYALTSLSEGRYRILVEPFDGPAQFVDHVFIRSDQDKTLDLVLDADPAIFGRVVDLYGEPVDDAHIIIQNGVDRRIRVGDDGRFRFDEFDPDTGPFTAIASGPGHEASDERVIEPGRKEVFEIASGGSIIGRVIDPDGHPLADARIAISIGESADDIRYHSRQFRRETRSDGRGEFELGPLRSGRYRLSADYDGYTRATSDPIRVSSGATSGPIVLRLESGASLSGVVRDSETGEPVRGAQLIFVHPVPRGRPPTVQSDDEGRYEFDTLPSGRHTLHVSHNLYDFEYIGGLQIQEGRHLDFDVDLDPADPDNPGQNIQGIGASLESGTDGFRVTSVQPDSPAESAGIQPDDVIVSIDGSSAEDLTLEMAVQIIRGEPGESVLLRVRRAGRGLRTVEVTRERVFIPQEDRVVREQAR